MPDFFTSSVLQGTITLSGVVLCTLASLAMGAAIAGISMFRSSVSRSFALTLALLPAMVQIVIMLVNGNLGAGVAVMGAFSLVRFRSVPGSAREIACIFFAMAIGLATGMGYLFFALVFLIFIGGALLLLTACRFGEGSRADRDLKVTIPETLDYEGIFSDLFAKYLRSAELIQVRTTNMGSLYELTYRIRLKGETVPKEFLDAIRCRNGNLHITCSRPELGREEL